MGDFSGHGHLDLAVINGCDNTVSILLNKGDGTFGPKTDYPTGNAPANIVAGDFDRNGTIDLAITNSADNTVSILLGKGDGTFKPKVDYPTGAGPSGILAADVNQDGKLDLITADSATPQSFTDKGKISLLLGNGNGSFLPPAQMFPTGRLSARVAAADFDSDGILDLAVTSFGLDRMTLLQGKGDGTFVTKGISGAAGFPLGIVAVDLNGDNLPDIAFVNPGSNTFSTYLSIPPKEAETIRGSTRQTVTVSVKRDSAKLPIAPGTYTLTVTGASGALQHEASGMYMVKKR